MTQRTVNFPFVSSSASTLSRDAFFSLRRSIVFCVGSVKAESRFLPIESTLESLPSPPPPVLGLLMRPGILLRPSLRREGSLHDLRELLRCRQFAFQLGRQFRLKLILRIADGVLLGSESVFDLHVILLGAEDDADGGMVVGPAFPVVEQAQVEVHRAACSGSKGSTFNSNATNALRKRW